MSDDGFFDEIASAPDDAAPYLVYSDALMLRGDPRGDLISIQHALETAPPKVAADLRRREAELLEKYEGEWLGPAAAFRGSLSVLWRFGFVHVARVIDGNVAALAALQAMPAADATLVELRIGSPCSRDERWFDVQPLVDALAWHRGLRRLRIAEIDLRGMVAAPPVRVPEQAKALDVVSVQTPQLTLEWDATPARLRHLEIRSPHFDARAVVAIREWPRLETLALWLADPNHALRMLSPKKVPRLRHLALCGTANTQQVVAELARMPIAEQLESLDLRGGTLTSSKALAPVANRVKLDVRWNRLGKEERAQLAAFGAHVQPQRRERAHLTDGESLRAMHERITQTYLAVDSSHRRKVYKKYEASSPDPFWTLESRMDAANTFEARERRDLSADIVTEADAHLVPIGGRDRADIYYALGHASDELVEGFEAECWLWKSVKAARWAGDTRDEIRALGLIGTTRMRRGDPTHALVAMDRVLAYYLENGSKSEQAWALRQRGNVDLVRSEFGAAERFYRRALEIYRELNDKHSEGIVLSELAGVLWSRQDWEGAVVILKEAIANRSADTVGVGSTYYNLGAVLNGMGRIDEAREAGEMSLAIFRKHGRSDGIGQALSLLGELAQRSNRHDEAQKLLDEALEHHRARGAVRETGVTLGNLSRVALDRGEYAKARTLCEEAIEFHRECGNKYNEGMQLLGLADAAIGERRLDDALAHVDEGLVPLRAIDNFPGMAALKLRRAKIEMLRGRYAEVDAHVDECISDTTRGNYPELVGWAQMYRAVARALEQRHAEVTPLVEEAERRLAKSTHGMLALAMAKAVIARLGGDDVPLPEPTGHDARLLAAFAR